METVLKDICETTRESVQLQVVVASEDAHTRDELCQGVSVKRLASLGTWFSQPVTPGILSVLRATKADLVHLHEPNPLATAAYLASGCRSRLIVHYHSDIVRQKKLSRLYRPLLNWALRKAEAIIVGSRELIENSPVLARHRSKCVVIPFGIDLRPFLALEPKPSPGPPLILAVGRLSYYKGFQYLIEAMRDLPARLVLVGDGECRAELQQQIQRLGLQDKVSLAGKIGFDALLDSYSQADLFCLPSCHASEAFGLVMVEAMAAGLPVVSTDLPTGVRSVNAHGVTGLVVPPASVEPLRAALALLCRQPDLRRRLGRNGRSRAQEIFSRENMGRQILNLYGAVCSPAMDPGASPAPGKVLP
jgi:glycosyltransferase involved in cell wall biosynthesis